MATELNDDQKRKVVEQAEHFAAGYREGQANGAFEGRLSLLDHLKPYVQHIGNCGAAGRDPEDSRCICGLRQVWHEVQGL